MRLKKSHRNCLTMPAAINFSSVSDISKQIVSEEPAAAKPTTRTLEAPPITTYTGPTLGVQLDGPGADGRLLLVAGARGR